MLIPRRDTVEWVKKWEPVNCTCGHTAQDKSFGNQLYSISII